MSAVQRMSLEEFLAWEERQESRYELVDGEAFAMAGGSTFHAHIGVNLAAALRQQLRPRGCFIFHEGMKVRVGSDVLYPDVVVSCDPQQLERNLVERPALIVEVLSPSTESFDRGRKWALYQQLAGLQAFLLVSQEALSVEVFVRAPQGWHYRREAGAAAVLELAAPSCRLPLTDVYDGLLERLG
ncbi:Uma2 family endonuclease [Nannocystis punicea]|uniref:Uma2 family endonuclease n=1 Tax=Nannocystis punicea TaxID=2995304 RepID=A0ABY7H8E2_9BACT|nr:Uma2 family endonuclease [Nannocystis poenicansa]WAS95357.1 Uma2 family endonuclease [Nannocystis poenicansa]